jgi:hypothetical protein
MFQESKSGTEACDRVEDMNEFKLEDYVKVNSPLTLAPPPTKEENEGENKSEGNSNKQVPWHPQTRLRDLARVCAGMNVGQTQGALVKNTQPVQKFEKWAENAEQMPMSKYEKDKRVASLVQREKDIVDESWIKGMILD